MGKAEAGASRRTVLEGGTRPRKRAASRDSWSARKERDFLRALADSCNVKLAAKKAGVSTSAIYVRRAKDAGFRRGWDQALAAAYAALEMMMLERALHGVEKTIELRSGETRVMREYSDRVGLALLRMHRDNATLADESGVGHEEYEEACERIIAKLDRLRERDSGVVETKAAVDRIALVRRARLGDSARSRAGNPGQS